MLSSAAMSVDPARHAIASVWKEEGPRVIGTLVRILRDVALAEELAHDALVAALEDWPRSGVPERPGAWLMTTAKHRALSSLRRAKLASRTGEALGRDAEAQAPFELDEIEARMTQSVGDDVLRLIFTACHPVLSTEARVALTLRLIGGLTTEEIARAFLTVEPTIAQRIVRAKRSLAESGVPFEVPSGEQLAPRLASVLEVVYLIFNEGYTATTGDDLMRPALAAEAIRIGELLAQLAPDEPEVHGLSALMLLHASRTATRVDADGEPVLLVDQDRARWDRALIARGLAALARAEALTRAPGRYQLQAAIAACHTRAASVDTTDWAAIAALYGELARLTPSPVIELNRAMAVSRAQGARAGLALLDKLRREPSLARYHLLPAARADLLERLGRRAEAGREFERAAELASNARQRARLLARAAACKTTDDSA
jgi:RNA polymerase sigma factor (sigma-70 family)